MGEGMSSFMVYKVMTKTNANFFKKKEFYVIRRFSDFLGLHQKLAEKYLQNGRIIPPAPDKNVVGTTKIKMAKDGGENYSNDEVTMPKWLKVLLARFVNSRGESLLYSIRFLSPPKKERLLTGDFPSLWFPAIC